MANSKIHLAPLRVNTAVATGGGHYLKVGGLYVCTHTFILVTLTHSVIKCHIDVAEMTQFHILSYCRIFLKKVSGDRQFTTSLDP